MASPDRHEPRKIAVAEGNPNMVALLREELSAHGYVVVTWIRSMSNLYLTIRPMPSEGVRAVIVADRISSQGIGESEGNNVTDIIHQEAKGIPVIGFSPKPLKHADYNVPKNDPDALFKTLATIFEAPAS